MRTARLGFALVCGAAALAPAARADDSVFGIRGLGFLGRPMSARAAGTGGAFALFDQASPLNPASLSRWRTMVGWGVSAPQFRTFHDGTTTTSLGSTRFPLIGFATRPSERLTIAVTVGDYLDRTWSVKHDTTIQLRGQPSAVTDTKTSLGGVSDIQLAGAWQVSDRVAVGIGLHALTGSARSQVFRHFGDSTYADFSDVSLTDFSGQGVSLGVTAFALRNLVVSATARFNTRLTAHKSTGDEARVHLPREAGLGAMYTPVPGVALMASAQYAGWSAASADLAARDSAGSRDVWSFALGGEFDTFRRGQGRVPLRLGWRTRQLPFVVPGSGLIRESAVTGGFALDFAGGHTTLDLTFEKGSRSSGALKETFTGGYVGLTVRP